MANTVEEIVGQVKNQHDVFYRAKLLLHLKKEKGLGIGEISRKSGIKPSYLCHFLRLNRLPEIVVDGYYAKSVTLSHLFILSRLKDPLQTIDAYENILKHNLTVLDTEMMVRQLLYGIKSSGKYLPQSAAEKINARIISSNKNISLKVIQSRIKGKLIIEIKDGLGKTTPMLSELLAKVSEVLQKAS